MSKKDDFVNLHLHTEYSLMDSVIRIPQLADIIKDYNQSSVAITDHGSVGGWYEFQSVLSRTDIKPIFGCEFYCKETYEKPKDSTRFHLVVLAKNNEGLKQINRMVRVANNHFYYKPLLPYPYLFEHPDDIFITTACALGSIGQSFNPAMKNIPSENAEVFLNKLLDVFGKDNVACEFQFHPDWVENNYNVQSVINERLLNLCDIIQPKYKIVTCDSHFLDEDDRNVRRRLQADGYKKQYSDQYESLKSNCVGNSELVYKFAEECEFPKEEVTHMIKNTSTISDLCNAEFQLNYGRVIPKFDKHEELKANFMQRKRKKLIK